MTDRLFNLIDKANAEFDDIDEFTAAIIELSRHKNVATVLVELLQSTIASHERFWVEIENSKEFKTTYDNDRRKALKAYEDQRACR